MPKNEQIKFYREPGGVYLMVLVGNGKSLNNMYDCVGEISYPGDVNDPDLALSQVSPDYLHHRCKRVAWNDLPEIWQQGFKSRLDEASWRYLNGASHEDPAA